jgi:tRNA A37 methylthiotransferase MiaB
MAHQAPISAMRQARWIGRRVRVLIDGVDTEDGCLIARTMGDAPDIDGIVRVRPDPNSRHSVTVETGQFCVADIVDSQDYDLEAVYVSS